MADNRKFVADVKRFADKTEKQMIDVFSRSFTEVLRIAQTPVAKGGDMPVDLGFLRNSLAIEINGREVAKGGDVFTLALSSFDIGDIVSASWGDENVGYAVPRHYMVGVGQGGGLWRDKAAQQWSRIVADNARRVR